MYVLPKGILLFSQVFGSFPLKRTVSKEGKTSLVFSWAIFTWGLVLVMYQSVMPCVGLYKDYTGRLEGHPIRMGSRTATVAVTLDILSLSIMAVVLFYCYVTRHRKFVSMCRMLTRVDYIMGRKMTRSESRLRVFLIFMSTVTVTGVSAYMDHQDPTSYFLPGKKSEDDSRAWSVYTPVFAAYCAQAVLLANFNHVSRDLADSFKAINCRIKVEVISKSFGQLMRGQVIPSVDVSPGSSSVTQLRRMIYCYWLMCDAVQEANTFFCWQVLASILTSFLHIIITLYYFFLHMAHGGILYLAWQAMWVFIHTFSLTLLVWNCTAVTEAASETGPMICKLINKDMNPWTINQLEILLPQLLHHNARFSALGLFEINTRILTSMAAAVTTYLVILIQFQTSTSSGHTGDRETVTSFTF